MAYHLSGHQAYTKAIQRRLSPVHGGLRYEAQEDLVSADALDRPIHIPRGTMYAITGTSDGNGYVMTIQDGTGATYYLEAEEGCRLCK